ncbi:hypothetical protein [Neptuniibacter sp. QD37_11]|uniref:hypothetical protein n=1 Tax=Neptuniibacter sp. QD37_11 TaxID=3398209 RepID=UPI0039F6269F
MSDLNKHSFCIDRKKICPNAIKSTAECLSLHESVILNILTTSIESLKGRSQYLAPTNSLKPASFPKFDLFDPRMDSFGNVEDMYVEYLVEIEASDLQITEATQEIESHPTYLRYLEMSEEGHEPPYINITESGTGKLMSPNRRRTLVAQELGKSIKGWLSPLNRETGLPLSYGDVIQSYELELSKPLIKNRNSPNLDVNL